MEQKIDEIVQLIKECQECIEELKDYMVILNQSHILLGNDVMKIKEENTELLKRLEYIESFL